MRILITGTRKGGLQEKVFEVLDEMYSQWVANGFALTDQFVIVHGAAPGVDRAASAWVHRHLGAKEEAHPATWTDGKKAGPIRNQKMVDLGADLCIAFPIEGSIGTWDCVRKARKAGIETMVIRDLVIRSKEGDK